ncbi:MAG: hypothetical protein FRX49_08135 [Trebouxia sp. A1-2]|nr:MAG: hypothetical protein FRX49_08135 [Trebouxia sp. A1-2]
MGETADKYLKCSHAISAKTVNSDLNKAHQPMSLTLVPSSRYRQVERQDPFGPRTDQKRRANLSTKMMVAADAAYGT